MTTPLFAFDNSVATCQIGNSSLTLEYRVTKDSKTQDPIFILKATLKSPELNKATYKHELRYEDMSSPVELPGLPVASKFPFLDHTSLYRGGAVVSDRVKVHGLRYIEYRKQAHKQGLSPQKIEAEYESALAKLLEKEQRRLAETKETNLTDRDVEEFAKQGMISYMTDWAYRSFHSDTTNTLRLLLDAWKHGSTPALECLADLLESEWAEGNEEALECLEVLYIYGFHCLCPVVCWKGARYFLRKGDETFSMFLVRSTQAALWFDSKGQRVINLKSPVSHVCDEDFDAQLDIYASEDEMTCFPLLKKINFIAVSRYYKGTYAFVHWVAASRSLYASDTQKALEIDAALWDLYQLALKRLTKAGDVNGPFTYPKFILQESMGELHETQDLLSTLDSFCCDGDFLPILTWEFKATEWFAADPLAQVLEFSLSFKEELLESMSSN